MQYCPLCSQNIFNKPSKDTCLSSLYRADHQMTIKLCALALESANSDQVIETSPNNFMYFSKQGSSSYSTICPETSNIGQLTRFRNLNIPLVVILTHPSFTFTDGTHCHWRWTLILNYTPGHYSLLTSLKMTGISKILKLQSKN